MFTVAQFLFSVFLWGTLSNKNPLKFPQYFLTLNPKTQSSATRRRFSLSNHKHLCKSKWFIGSRSIFVSCFSCASFIFRSQIERKKHNNPTKKKKRTPEKRRRISQEFDAGKYCFSKNSKWFLGCVFILCSEQQRNIKTICGACSRQRKCDRFLIQSNANVLLMIFDVFSQTKIHIDTQYSFFYIFCSVVLLSGIACIVSI